MGSCHLRSRRSRSRRDRASRAGLAPRARGLVNELLAIAAGAIAGAAAATWVRKKTKAPAPALPAKRERVFPVDLGDVVVLDEGRGKELWLARALSLVEGQSDPFLILFECDGPAGSRAIVVFNPTAREEIAILRPRDGFEGTTPLGRAPQSLELDVDGESTHLSIERRRVAKREARIGRECRSIRQSADQGRGPNRDLSRRSARVRHLASRGLDAALRRPLRVTHRGLDPRRELSSLARVDGARRRAALFVDAEELVDAGFGGVEALLRVAGEGNPLLEGLQRLFERELAGLEALDDFAQSFDRVLEADRLAHNPLPFGCADTSLGPAGARKRKTNPSGSTSTG